MISKQQLLYFLEKEFLRPDGYGMFEVKYDATTGRYSIFGFRKEDSEWNYHKKTCLHTTRNTEWICDIAHKYPCIFLDELFCLECLRKKNVEAFKKEGKVSQVYYANQVWGHTSRIVADEMIDFLLTEELLDWRHVSSLVGDTYDKRVVHPYCSNCEDNFSEHSDEANFCGELGKYINKLFLDNISFALMNCREDFLELFIKDHLHLVEEGLMLIETQKRVENGIIDILTRDKNGTLTILELKVVTDCKDAIVQSCYYPTCFEEDVRMIVIAPGYTKKVYSAFSNVKNVELKYYFLNQNRHFQIDDYVAEAQTDVLSGTEDNLHVA